MNKFNSNNVRRSHHLPLPKAGTLEHEIKTDQATRLIEQDELYCNQLRLARKNWATTCMDTPQFMRITASLRHRALLRQARKNNIDRESVRHLAFCLA